MIDDRTFTRIEPVKSPLDPFLCQFLATIKALPQGYHPASDRHVLTASLSWTADFADAILTSAQVRGLVERVPPSANRRRAIWRLSKRGRSWLETPEIPCQAPFSAELDQASPAL